jgi:hypothetical protein
MSGAGGCWKTMTLAEAVLVTRTKKRVTLVADESLIEQARTIARERGTSLNAALREWLEQYAAQGKRGVAIRKLMHRLRHVRSAGPYTRDEMNER